MFWKIQFQITKLCWRKVVWIHLELQPSELWRSKYTRFWMIWALDYSSCLFCKSNIPYQLRNDNKLIQPLKRTTTFGIKSVAYFGTHLWNMLPNHIQNSVSLYDFKSLIRKWSDPTCCCSVCTQVVWSLFCRYKSIYYGLWFYHFSRVYMGKYCHL